MSADDIRLIATDLDGTVIGKGDEYFLYEQFRDKLNDIRRTNNALWAVCTGRRLKSFRKLFDSMRIIGIVPDYVIIKHAYIYSRTSFGYFPHVLWNLQIGYSKWLSRVTVARAIKRWQSVVLRNVKGARTMAMSKDRLCLQFNTPAEAATAAELLKKQVEGYRYIRVFPYVKEVDVRCIPYTKGLSLSELCKHIGCGPDNVLAIGDGHNDISMFGPEVAMYTGCPANSEPEVISAVHETGGHIAEKPFLAGVVEVVDAHINGEVLSALPEWWVDPSKGANPRRARRPSKEAQDKKALRRGVLFAMSAYAVITVLASFRLIPFVSGLIMKPMYIIVKITLDVMEFFGL